MNPSLSFPTQVPFSGKELAERYWRWSQTRCRESSCHVSILLPNRWRPVDVPCEPPTPEHPMTGLSLARSLDEPRGEIEVGAVLLEREVAPADWLTNFLEAGGHAIVHSRRTESRGGDVADILTRTETPEGPVLSRWLAIKDHDRLFVLQARCLEGDYPPLADDFLIAVSGFDLLHPGDWPLAERLRSFTRREPGDFCLFYPESWQLAEDDGSNENARVFHINHAVEEAIVGKTTVAVVARDAEADPQKLADNYLGELERGGISVSRVPLAASGPVGGFEATWQSHMEAARGENAIEVRITVGQRPDAWFLLALFGPARPTAPDVWAVNRRAYEILLDWFRTPPERDNEDGEAE
jgi:hypothetical protein